MLNNTKFKELNEKIKYSDEQKSVAIANENIEVLLKLMHSGHLKPNHVPVAFSYLFLQTYMFRYTRYYDYVPNTQEIKQILGYSPTTKSIDHIVSKNSVLVESDLLITLHDFPILHEWVDEQLEFTMVSSLNNDNEFGRLWRKDKGINYNASCKYPVLAFYSDLEAYDGISMDNNYGTFFMSNNMTLIEWNTFNYCMSNVELGCTGFFLYSFIKCYEGKYYNCTMSYGRFRDVLGLSYDTLQKYIKALRQYNLIKASFSEYVIGAGKGEIEPTQYFANSFVNFTYDKLQLKKPRYISLDEHLEIKRKKEQAAQAEKELYDTVNSAMDELLG